MRIALYHNLPSGGAKRTLAELVRRLASRHEVDAYSLSSADHEFADIRPVVQGHTVLPYEPLPLFGSPFGRFNQVVRSADLKRLDRLLRRLARRIDDGRYDVAFVHPCRFEQAPSLLRHLKKTPSVYYCQEPRRSLYESMPPRPYDDDAVGRRRMLNRLDPLPVLYRRMLRAADQGNTRGAGKVLVNSRFMADAVARIYGVKASVSYHGVDADQFKPMNFEKGHMVLSVGSLTPLKGFDFLIEAMSRYPAAGRPALVIAANFQNADERAHLENLARGRGVPIVLAGSVSDADLLRLYNEAKAVVYAPVREPFGLVPLEAMACETPVAAVAEGGIPETVVDGETGLLTERDPERFAAAVRKLVEDPALARACGVRGRRHVLGRWSWERAVSTVEAHLEAASESAALPPTAVSAR